MTKISDMGTTQLEQAARDHDRLQNEGGEGYNPYRNEIASRARAVAAARPRSLTEQLHETLREIDIQDCSIARESGTYDATRVAALREQASALRAAIDAEALAGIIRDGWTLEVTRARRAANNAMVRGLPVRGGKVDQRVVDAWLKAQGWTHADLRRAITLHGIAGERV
jgi:hypothetical protein